MYRLQGLATLITGAAEGIGEGIARAFVLEGAVVVLTDIQDEKGEQLAHALGDRALYQRLDVRATSSMHRTDGLQEVAPNGALKMYLKQMNRAKIPAVSF